MNIILFEPDSTVLCRTDGSFTLSCSDFRAGHITDVLKLKEGDTFRMGFVNTSEGTALIEKMTPDSIRFTYTPQTVPFMYPVTLIAAQVRPICMKRILRDASSLGCGRLILTGSDTGEKSYLSSGLYKTGEYKNYLLDGAMQSAHAGLPDVLFTENVGLAIAAAQTDIFSSNIPLKRIFNTDSTGTVSRMLLDNITGAVPLGTAPLEGSVILAVGPERGWSDRERGLFSKAGYSPMLLGERVLRTETACAAALSVIICSRAHTAL